jgi:NAD(P)-dependent dehydrogenase (short-subunit alcohol dehydrogenase family)
MDLQLKDRIVLITGGSKGIGLAVAKAFLSEEAQVVICGRDVPRLESALKEIKDKFPAAKVWGRSCDVTSPSEIESLISFIKNEVGGVDILINNAGAGSEETIMNSTDEKWDHYWNLHVMSTVRFTRHCVPLMKERPGEGVILNTASMCATQPLYYEPIYNTTKAALNMLTKCMAAEFVKDNIRVNTISPGLVLTPDWYNTAGKLSKKEGITVQQYFDRIAQQLAPIGRFASAEEVASFYVFLASPLCSYCLGTNFHIDGGAIQVLN